MPPLQANQNFERTKMYSVILCGGRRERAPALRKNNFSSMFVQPSPRPTNTANFLLCSIKPCRGGNRENDMLYRFRWFSTADTRLCQAEWRRQKPGVNEPRRVRANIDCFHNSLRSSTDRRGRRSLQIAKAFYLLYTLFSFTTLCARLRGIRECPQRIWHESSILQWGA